MGTGLTFDPPPMKDALSEAARLRTKAVEIRTLAETKVRPVNRAELLDIAKRYDDLATQVERLWQKL